MIWGGQITPKKTLIIYETIAYNNILVFLFSCASVFLLYNAKISRFMLLPLSLLLLMCIYLPGANQYGFEKLINFGFPFLFGSILAAYIIESGSKVLFYKYFLGFIILITILSLIYKLNFGLFNRQTSFGLNGPIVFGRLMGLGIIISIFTDIRWKKTVWGLLGFGLFLSMSKGPIISMFVVCVIIHLTSSNTKFRIRKYILPIAALFVLIFLFNNLDFSGENRILLLLYRLKSGDFELSDFGSRVSLYFSTISYLKNNYLGCGLGCWSNVEQINSLGFFYPHNLILEVYTELGFFVGTVFIIYSQLYLISKDKVIFYLGSFITLSAMFSGDLVDSRYLVIISTMSLYMKLNGYNHDIETAIVKR
ncbi:membrane hypothetical protein [Vibrio chagasii]|nr:membrane hypothetical protein [Vibrio chagasii]CAH6797592.1 membrane hypothetical protein [Vibrio chagasii]CAH7178239.1 membrane hypothetical protein [Vibrio chagasii]CAH7408798.1 membrane hypothetical protein [Vibrio chagasii]